MSLLAPKIDSRTYDKLVADTELLAQCFTGFGFLILRSPILEPSKEDLNSFKLNLIICDSSDSFPTEGSNIVILGKIKDYYHLRIFDANKQKIIDEEKEKFFLDETLRKHVEKEFSKFQTKQSLIEISDPLKRNLLQHLAFPKEGKGIVVIGRDISQETNLYHVRIFDWTGKQIVEENSFKPDEKLLSLLKEVFHHPSNNEFVDNKSKSKILFQIQKSLGLTFKSQWLPPENKVDAARALIRIFGRMAMMVSDRLNRVPEKHFLAFLNLIGATQQPPRPARVPLTAYLVDNSPVDAIIPAHTQIAALPQEGETDEVLFETEQDLVVMRSQLQAVIVHQGGQYCDQILAATTGTTSFPVFEIEQPNTIYIGADQLMTKSDSQEIQLAIANPESLTDKWQWSYWDGETWQVLTPKLDKDRLTLNLPESLSKPQSKVIEGQEAQWLRGIAPNILPSLDPKLIRLVRAAIQETIPDKAFFNTEEIDLSKDFYPLGETPHFNDTFYIASSNILSLAGSKVTLHFESSLGIKPKPSSNPAPSIIWETWDGESWTPVFENTLPDKAFYTNDWNTKTFKMPNEVAPVEVNGEKNYWLRARLISGNYGGESQFEPMEMEFNLYTDTTALPNQGRGTVNVLRENNAYKVRIFDWNGNKNKIETLNPDENLKTELDQVFPPNNPTIDGATKRKLIQKIQAYLNYIPEPIFRYRSSSESGYFPPCLKSVKLSRTEIANVTPKLVLQKLPSNAFICGDSKSVKSILYIASDQISTLPTSTDSTEIKLKKDSILEWKEWQWSYWNGENWQELSAKDDKLYITLTPVQPTPPPISNTAKTPQMKTIEGIKAQWLRGISQKVLSAPKEPVFFLNNSDYKKASKQFVATNFYLGFDRPFPNQVIGLYLQVAPLNPGDLQNPTPPNVPAKLQWQYSVAEEKEKWRSLSVQDGTQNLSQRGIVQFIGPTDFAPQTLFGRSAYWLRLRLLEGGFQIQPRLQRILTNTVWAIQATTHQDEILGNGTGDPNLMLKTLNIPVLPEQQLLVREPEQPSPEERAAIEKQEGKDAIAVSRDVSGQLEEIWVRWHEVTDFYGSGSRDRHYVLDRMTGEIRFGGDGQGMAPPMGRNNIRMARYQSGGGSQGNQAAETVTDLKTTVPYVDRVINHEPASGGADLESIAAVQESAPKQLRHRDRAVTWQDIEDLTYAASSEIARVKPAFLTN